MMKNKSGIVTVEAAIFLAVVTIALVTGFSLLASEIYNADYTETVDAGVLKADAEGDEAGVLQRFIFKMNASLF